MKPEMVIDREYFKETFLMMGHYIVHETTLMQRLLQLNVSVLIIMQIKKDSKLFYRRNEEKCH